MKYISPIIGAASGSMGGTTFARNRGGNYMRARVIPINPNSAAQQEVRADFAFLVNRWTESLSDAQRGSWEAYADAVPRIDDLGQSRNLTGQQWYIGCNQPRIRSGVGLPLVDTGPTLFNTGPTSEIAMTLDATANEADVSFDNGEPWANEDDAGMLLYASRPTNPTVNFFVGPYQLLGLVPGNSTTPPTSPATFSLPFPVSVGQKIHVVGRLTRADGRLSSPFSTSLVATT